MSHYLSYQAIPITTMTHSSNPDPSTPIDPLRNTSMTTRRLETAIEFINSQMPTLNSVLANAVDVLLTGLKTALRMREDVERQRDEAYEVLRDIKDCVDRIDGTVHGM
jgi:Asp-tRNA(Asn)/Glu-tRNA(Gln) amidotransferase C subunit